MKTLLFISSTLAAGFSIGYAIHLRLAEELAYQALKRADRDFSCDETKFVSRYARTMLRVEEKKAFIKLLNE